MPLARPQAEVRSMSDTAPDWYQYIFCAVCMECQDLGKTPELAITIVDGTAVCEEHRRRVDGYANAVRGARRFLQRDENGGYRRGSR